jgi:hypothetical protein
LFRLKEADHRRKRFSAKYYSVKTITLGRLSMAQFFSKVYQHSEAIRIRICEVHVTWHGYYSGAIGLD